MSESEHDWFAEHTAAYVMNGLTDEERARFEQHAATCDTCAAELAKVKQLDQQMNALFATVSPKLGFDEAIIRRLSQRNAMVRNAAIAAAAAIMLGGFGYVASELVNNGRLPTFAVTDGRIKVSSNLRQAGQAILLYEQDNKGNYPRAAYDALPKKQIESPSALARQENKSAANSAAVATTGPLVGGANSHGVEGQNVLHSDGHVEFTQNPLCGVQRDVICTANTANSAGAALPNGPFDSNDSTLLPIDDDEKTPEKASSQLKSEVAAAPQSSSFKPFAIAAASGDSTNDLHEDQLVTITAGRQESTKDLQAQDQLAASRIVAKQDAVNIPAVDTAVPTASSTTSAPAPAQPGPATPPATQSSNRKIIRNGDMQFEVDSFDSAAMQVSKIVTEENGYIGTANSDRLPNGKMSGTVEVRVPPDHLDVLVLKLRALGDLKSQKITAEDITKQYTDLNSELRADRAMEERLLDLIQNGKGQIKDLLAAEKELGEWRTKIEKITGELNYDDSLIAYSTLELTLTEKNIQTPALASQTETVDMGVETEDVEKARDAALRAIDEVKGRIIDSELKQLDAGQVAGKIVADVPATSAGGVIDRLRQLGTVSRLEIQRQEVTTDGQGNPVHPETSQPEKLIPGIRTERKDTRLTVSLYNLANIAPRETTVAELACDDVEASYHAILARVDKAGGRVLSSALSRPKPDEVTGSIAFEVPTAASDGVLLDVRSAGDVMQLNTTKNADTNNVTTSKHGFSVQLRSIATVDPRQVQTLSVATVDVPGSYDKLLSKLAEMKARIVMSRLDKEDNQPNQTAGYVDFEIKRVDADAAETSLAALGDIVQRQVLRSTDNQNTLDSKIQFKVALHNATLLTPREAWTVAIETDEVEHAQTAIATAAVSAGGRVVDSTLAREAGGRTTARMIVEVPFTQTTAMLDHVKDTGEVRVINSTKNPSAPDGKLARSQFEITLGTPDALVKDDRGVWATIRSGLSTSIGGLLWSLELVVIGICFVLPWALLVMVGWKLFRRWRTTSK